MTPRAPAGVGDGFASTTFTSLATAATAAAVAALAIVLARVKRPR